jgi:hypothetical protein
MPGTFAECACGPHTVLLRRAPGEVPDLYLGLLYPTEEYRVYG